MRTLLVLLSLTIWGWLVGCEAPSENSESWSSESDTDEPNYEEWVGDYCDRLYGAIYLRANNLSCPQANLDTSDSNNSAWIVCIEDECAAYSLSLTAPTLSDKDGDFCDRADRALDFYWKCVEDKLEEN